MLFLRCGSSLELSKLDGGTAWLHMRVCHCVCARAWVGMFWVYLQRRNYRGHSKLRAKIWDEEMADSCLPEMLGILTIRVVTYEVHMLSRLLNDILDAYLFRLINERIR